jgi:YidC/Oxa1 family membrane protein insertase
MAFIVGIMHSAMSGIQRAIGAEWGWGLAIMGLTILVRVVILPLTVIQGRSTVKMQQIQPELNKIQKKYKDDPERLNLEIMDLYKRNKVNPMMGCLPLLVQFPVLIAMIRALDYEPLKGAKFLTLVLGQPGGFAMALVAVATTYLSMKFSPAMGAGAQQGGSQNTMMLAMMGLMFFFSWKYSAAVSVYIITANLVGLLERYLVPRPGTVPEGAGSSEKR